MKKSKYKIGETVWMRLIFSEETTIQIVANKVTISRIKNFDGEYQYFFFEEDQQLMCNSDFNMTIDDIVEMEGDGYPEYLLRKEKDELIDLLKQDLNLRIML